MEKIWLFIVQNKLRRMFEKKACDQLMSKLISLNAQIKHNHILYIKRKPFKQAFFYLARLLLYTTTIISNSVKMIQIKLTEETI